MIPTQSEVGGEYESRVKLIKMQNYSSTYYWASNSSITWGKVAEIFLMLIISDLCIQVIMVIL